MCRRVAMVALLALSLTGCRDTVSPRTDEVATVRLLPRVLDLAVAGGQASVIIEGTSTYGVFLEPAPRVFLYLRDTTIATVLSPSLVTGRKAGATYLIAQAADWPALARDSILVRVGQFQSER